MVRWERLSLSRSCARICLAFPQVSGKMRLNHSSFQSDRSDFFVLGDSLGPHLRLC